MGRRQEAVQSKPRKSRLEQLPLEAKQTVLSALTDLASLEATAITCSALYYAFKNAEELIITEVLLNEVDIDVLPEAIIAQESRTWTSAKPQIFAAEHLQIRLSISSKTRWNWFDAILLRNAAKYINYFAADFAKQALVSQSSTPSPPSREELNRIKRALYRFEIYMSVFPDTTPPSRRLPGQSTLAPCQMFFQSFSPWENEQLASVYEYLFSIIAPAFNEIVEHDVTWGGKYNIARVEDVDSLHIQGILFQGLKKAFKIATANSYEARYELIYEKSPTLSRAFEGLRTAHPRNIRPFTGHVLHSYDIKSFYEDPDAGPVDVWSWAHQGEHDVRRFVNSVKRQGLRDWGYVMLDRSRLESMGVLDAHWSTKLVDREDWRGIEGSTGLKRSWERRQLIDIAGGTGWWSEQDESKVQWPKGWSPWDDEEMRKSCPYCIGEVRCAPHRLILRVEGKGLG